MVHVNKLAICGPGVIFALMMADGAAAEVISVAGCLCNAESREARL